MNKIKIGAVLPTAMEELTDPRTPGVAEAARAVEEHGLESLWVADLVLGEGTPALEPTLALAGAATVTNRVQLGFGVLSVPPRPLVWLASQVATLQHLSQNRLLLGVGVGGFPEAPLWKAMRASARERGRTTDAALELLPALVSGEQVHLAETGVDFQLAPPAPMPPVVVGGSERAFERVLRTGAEWFPSNLSPSNLSPASLRRAVERLHAMADHRGLPRPPVTVGGHLILGQSQAARHAYDALVQSLVEHHGASPEEAAAAPLRARDPEELAEVYTAYTEAGADRIVAGADAMGWHEQLDFIAQAHALLPG